MKFKFNEQEFYINDLLAEKLDLMCERCTQRKFDNLLLIDGDEGYGKSTLGVSIGAYISYKTGRTFNVNNIFFDVDKLLELGVNSKDQILLWDEAALAGLASESYSKMQLKLLKMLMVGRKKRHFYLFLIPKFYRLREPIIDRAIGLVHVYARDEKELGRFCYYRKNNKQYLYDQWRHKKQKAYSKAYNFHGTFPDIMAKVIDEEAYDRMKDEAIKSILGKGDGESKEMAKLKAKFQMVVSKLASIPGLTQEQLAKDLGIDRKTLYNWKTGGDVSVGMGNRANINDLGNTLNEVVVNV